MTPKSSSPNKLNDQIKIESTKAKKAVKAIKLEMIPPIGPTILEAPVEIASNTLFSPLMINFYYKFHTKISSKDILPFW